MKIYDNTIIKVKALLGSYEARNFYIKKSDWPEVTDREMILKSEMAYELGTERMYGIGTLLVTSDCELVSNDSVRLIGPDISEIEKDANYARIAIVRVDESVLGQGQALYSAIRGLEFTRYHFYPKGFMLRISATQKKESVRVGKNELKQGLDFAKIGNMMIDAFKKNKMVEAVSLYYITDSDFDYAGLKALSEESEAITKTIDHISTNVVMDCDACNLQEICDEVEGLKELHFGANK